jgi:hypothetical protein
MKKEKKIRIKNKVLVLLRQIQRLRNEADRDMAKNKFVTMKEN